MVRPEFFLQIDGFQLLVSWSLMESFFTAGVHSLINYLATPDDQDHQHFHSFNPTLASNCTKLPSYLKQFWKAVLYAIGFYLKLEIRIFIMLCWIDHSLCSRASIGEGTSKIEKLFLAVYWPKNLADDLFSPTIFSHPSPPSPWPRLLISFDC